MEPLDHDPAHRAKPLIRKDRTDTATLTRRNQLGNRRRTHLTHEPGTLHRPLPQR
jgi:hypothetical protein